MARIVITHKVQDVEHWLKLKADRVADLSPFAHHVTDHVAMDGSNNVAVTAEVDDVAAAQAMLAAPTPQMVASMEKQGIIQPIVAHIEK